MVLAVLGLMEVLHILVPKAATIIEDIHVLHNGGETQLVMVMDREGRVAPNFPLLLHNSQRKMNFPLVTNEAGVTSTNNLPEGDYLVLVPGTPINKQHHRVKIERGKSMLVAVRVERPAAKAKVPAAAKTTHYAAVRHR